MLKKHRNTSGSIDVVDNRVMIEPEVCDGIVLDWKLLLLVTVFQFLTNTTFPLPTQQYMHPYIHYN